MTSRGTARLVLISTGGTIEKTYDAHAERLTNDVSVLDHMLAQLHQPGLTLERLSLMNKDSLAMTEHDHGLIARTAHEYAARPRVDGVVVVHGTGTLEHSGERTAAAGEPRVPIVFTGAMRPFELRDSDALQNLTEALLTARLLTGGVHVAMHGHVLAFPGAVKNTETLTFERD